MVSGEVMVPDGRMTASGQWDEFHAPPRARLDTIGKDNEHRGGWVANTPWTQNQWIQVLCVLITHLYTNNINNIIFSVQVTLNKCL